MNLQSGDALTQMAFSICENKGVFAVLLGSGISRAAEIPTGWEITLDLVRRVALAQGVQNQSDWAKWYREQMGKEPNYSDLLEDIASSPEERRAILHDYIEPTDEDREEGRKIPTAAHRAIANMVRDGYIRVIITTNFDRLMENALREAGIEPTVVSSIDALLGAEPLTHSKCYLLKLHGDYKDARILNTEEELNGYAPQYNALLDRIFDEHGLVVCGWSGEWDHALRAAFLRAPNRRYSTFWAARGELGSGAQQLIEHRRARVIPIIDADGFFVSLYQRVETLHQTKRQNPLSIELQVASAKRFLNKPEYRIHLDELISEETDRLIERLDSPDFQVPNQFDAAEFSGRVKMYESVTEGLATMVGVLGRWGSSNELPLVIDVIRSLYSQAERVGSGLTIYLDMRSYPAVLVFTAYGLGLTRAGRWRLLHELCDAMIDRAHDDPARSVEALFLGSWRGGSTDAWRSMPGLARHLTPVSDHLLSVFSVWSKSFIGLTPDFVQLFEKFEMICALAHLEKNDKDAVRGSLAGDRQNGWTWMPIGRSAWHETYAVRIKAELRSDATKSALLKAGFAKGDPEFFDLFFENFSRIAGRPRWS
jgi:hypothetical protein